jgi:predicted CXXCH cytochrome family protein
MRKLCISLLAVALAVMLAPSMAMALDGPHDTAFPAGTGCAACHTPHTNVASGGLLWGQTLTTETFSPYSSPTLTGTVTFVGNKPTGSSLLCLSCHDGVTVVGALAVPAAMSTKVIGTDLSVNHPVSVTYDETDTGLTAIASLNALLVLESGNVECGTCHNPHDNTTVPKYLEIAAGTICTECHSNK